VPAASGALLCITPAPAIDRTAFVERIELDTVLRPTETRALPGGKGVNAARVAARLGAEVITTGIAGGHAGRWLVEALDQEGLAPRFATSSAEARTAYVTIDTEGRSVLVYERLAKATAAEYEAFLQLLTDELLPRCGRAIVAGSIPAGLDADGYARIVVACREAQRPLLVDASGGWLRSALGAHPDVVKIGRIEVIEAGLTTPDADSRDAAIALVDAGAHMGIVTDGAAPVAAADADTFWHVSVPHIEAVNPVGSGDAFNAALSMALSAHDDIAAALADGVAAGAANALTMTAGDLDVDVTRTLRERVTVTSTRR
jgi:tagatose 6-phosphate kinase